MLQPRQTPKEKKNTKDATQMKNMRPTGPKTGRIKPTMGSAKNGKSFPDLNKDGKITKADVLKGRGVIAKKGMSVKKAQNGIVEKISNTKLKDVPGKALKIGKKVVNRVKNATVGDVANVATTGAFGAATNAYKALKKKAKTGASIKTCKGGC